MDLLKWAICNRFKKCGHIFSILAHFFRAFDKWCGFILVELKNSKILLCGVFQCCGRRDFIVVIEQNEGRTYNQRYIRTSTPELFTGELRNSVKIARMQNEFYVEKGSLCTTRIWVVLFFLYKCTDTEMQHTHAQSNPSTAFILSVVCLLANCCCYWRKYW